MTSPTADSRQMLPRHESFSHTLHKLIIASVAAITEINTAIEIMLIVFLPIYPKSLNLDHKNVPIEKRTIQTSGKIILT